MQEACETTRGGMAAIIGLDEATTREVCADTGVALANLNCPGQLVISGEAEKIAQACELAKGKGAKRAMPLTVAGAYHSKLMASAQEKLKIGATQSSYRGGLRCGGSECQSARCLEMCWSLMITKACEAF